MIAVGFSQMKVSTVVNIFTYLTGVLCIVALSGQVPFIYPLIFLAMMALSFYLDIRKIVIPRWLLTTLSVAIVLYFFLQVEISDLIGHVMEILFILMGIKFLERRAVRDFMQIYALALFVLAGLGLMAMGMAFVIYLLLFLFLLSLSLIFLTFYSQDPNLELTSQTVKTMVIKCLWIPILAIPLSTVMFVILPRTSYPILTFLNRPEKARAGFTDNVRLGHVSDITEDDRVTFRATMDRVDESELYWRGITLDRFDGTAWTTARKGIYSRGKDSRDPVGRSISQTIYLEPYDSSRLFALDKPLQVDLRRARKNEDLTFTMPYFIDRRLRYAVISTLSPVIPEENINLKIYLQLPADVSPRVISLGRSFSVKGDREATTLRIMDYLRHSGRYTYTLKHLPVSKNPLESFLFDSPSGHCEFFASAMAVLLRVNDIPSRLVGGYRGGDYNEMGGYYLVPQKNAHVWVEAHLPGKGWVRFDPTPASEALSATSTGGVFGRLRLFFDTINYYWYGIVLTYNLERQISITRSIMSELKNPGLAFTFLKGEGFRYFLLSVMGIGLVLLTLFLYKARKPREILVLNGFLRRLKAAGYEKKGSEGLEEFLARIDNDDVRKPALDFVRDFEGIYYNDRQFSSDDLRRLKGLADRVIVNGRN